ncbi:kinesin-like protein KIN-14P [Lycium barbarum]|uniref:kinesin-like protein KIN-14P n=1 Tax=Lycium barbarum TaxID=112863 RepID=UPI00293E3C03|nr:kinesin-like protein KIN-14P [Lycium barbarum]
MTACTLLRKVLQEINRQISTQAEHLRTQNILLKPREEKYQLRIRVFEALATGTSEKIQDFHGFVGVLQMFYLLRFSLNQIWIFICD